MFFSLTNVVFADALVSCAPSKRCGKDHLNSDYSIISNARAAGFRPNFFLMLAI